jgi:hypothetical protein
VSHLRNAALVLLAATALAGCQSNPFKVVRSNCPAVAIPTYTGDVTLFRPGTPPNADNIDIVATMTDVRAKCVESAADYVSNVTYDVVARRTDAVGARNVTLPVFACVIQGGNLLVSKQIGAVTVAFADGQLRSIGHSGANATISRASLTLPAAVSNRINRKRKAGDADAAVDPLSDPEVKAAIRATSFEVLVGFQFDEAALAYNVTK